MMKSRIAPAFTLPRFDSAGVNMNHYDIARIDRTMAALSDQRACSHEGSKLNRSIKSILDDSWLDIALMLLSGSSEIAAVAGGLFTMQSMEIKL